MEKEIEVKFLEINKDELVKKIIDLGATDLGEVMLEEIIIYDKDLRWLEEKRFIRIRKSGDKTKITYKEHSERATDGAKEIEFEINDIDKASLLFEKIGLVPYRRQQKKRHTLKLGNITFDIDTWPRVPTYAEIEGPSFEELEKISGMLGLDWQKVVHDDAKTVLEKVYNIPMGSMRWLTFDRFE